MKWLKSHVGGAALSAVAAIVALKLVVPGVFDFIFDLIVFGLVWLVVRLNKQ